MERRMKIEKKVMEVVRSQLGIGQKKIHLETSFIEDLDADSLSIVELSLAFEEAFDIEIPDEASSRIKTVKDAVDYINESLEKMNANSGNN